MPSSFKSLNLFGSGPHRFRERPRGQTLLAEREVSPDGPTNGTLYLGPLEPTVEVMGRLVADDEEGLWTLRDAITDELLDPPAPGTLVDQHAREWPDMSFVLFEPADRTDRGRKVSLAYRAVFMDFKTYPQ